MSDAKKEKEQDTEVLDEKPKASKKEERGIVGTEEEFEVGAPERTLATPPTGVKEHTLVADEDKERGSGPIVEQHLEDHLQDALPPRESDTEKSGATHLDDPDRV